MKLLTSVRDLAEAKIAISAGTDWLDMKEPTDGALGAVPEETIAEVVNWVNQVHPELPVSATIGDHWFEPDLIPQRVAAISVTGVDYVKIGIFADAQNEEILTSLAKALTIHRNLIVICFAERPPNLAVLRQILDLGVAGIMLDTAEKAGNRLTELISLQEIADFVARGKLADCLVGLAGQLRIEDIEKLRPLGASYLGFRGALCEQQQRTNALSERRIEAILRNIK
ncbi:MAG: (5-formylfuran-3-yl)methyl phosphate synthase [Pseudomonadota bacterium]